MTRTLENPADLILHIHQEIDINAPIAIAFDAMLEQIGPSFATPDGKSMSMKLEAWPGGRWYRDLGNNAGHFWGHVQVIKPPTLLEITGPMFMSSAVVSHIQYRLTEQGRGTHLSLIHRALGEISAEHRAGVAKGWEAIVAQIRDRAQR